MNQKVDFPDAPKHEEQPSHQQALVEIPRPKRAVRKSITTLTLTSSTCKWPFGDPTSLDFHYCGQPPQAGRPYCDTHDRMSYQSAQRKSRP